MNINRPDTNNAKIKLIRGTIRLETHHGTLDLSTVAITQLLPLINLTHGP